MCHFSICFTGAGSQKTGRYFWSCTSWLSLYLSNWYLSTDLEMWQSCDKKVSIFVSIQLWNACLLESKMEKSCCSCQRITKCKCIKCEVYVCAICAPETHDTVAQTNYKPMHQVGICQNCLAEDTNPKNQIFRSTSRWKHQQSQGKCCCVTRNKSKYNSAQENKS